MLLGKEIGEIALNHVSDMRDMEDTLSGLQAIVSSVEGALGIQGPGGHVQADPTIWGNLHDLLLRLRGYEQLAQEVEGAHTTLRLLGHHVLEIRGTLAAAGIVGDATRASSGAQPSILRHSTASVAKVPSWDVSFGGAHQPPVVAASPPSKDTDVLMSNGNASHSGAIQGSDAALSAWKTSFKSLHERVLHLERAGKGGSGGSGDNAVFFDNHVFRSGQDVGAFLEKHLGAGVTIPSGLFPGPHQLLQSVHTNLSGEVPGMREFESLKKLQVSNRDYLATMATLTPLPGPFGATKRLSSHPYTTPASTKCRFKALPSWADWGTRANEDELFHKYLRELDNVESTLHSAISEAFRSHGPVHLLATSMLTKSLRFVRGLFEYMTECYESLQAAFSDSAATWDLVCFSVEQLFFNEFRSARAAMVVEDFSDPRLLAIDVVWATLRRMSVVDAFNKQGIKNHPSMNGAQIRFVLKQSQANRNADLAKTVKAQASTLLKLEELIASQGVLIETQRKHLNSVEGRADAACSAAGVGKGGKKKGDKLDS